MTRIYVVTEKANATTKTRLVEATTEGQALKHVAKTQYAVEIGRVKEVAKLVQAGTPIELANGAELAAE